MSAPLDDSPNSFLRMLSRKPAKAAPTDPRPGSRGGVDAEAVAAGVYTDLRVLTTRCRAAQDVKLFKHQAAKSLLLGNVRSRFRGRGMEFEEARLYLPGDDIRAIDWRVSARTGKTHTKVYAEERERPVHIVLDQRSCMFFGSRERFKSVLAAELAACLAWASLGASDRIGGQIFGDTREIDVRARRNKQAILRFLTGIAEFNHALPDGHATSDGPRPAAEGRDRDPRRLDYVLEECRRIVRPGTALFVLSDFSDFNDDAAKLLSALGRHAEITLFWITDPLEFEFDLSGRLGMSDGHAMRAVDVSRELRDRYRAERAAQQDRLARAARRSRSRLIPVDTTQEPVSFLRRLYRG
jgi:uncharacterized protein (DUF58 family)